MVQRSGPEHRAYQGALLVHGQSDWDTCTQSSRANSSKYKYHILPIVLCFSGTNELWRKFDFISEKIIKILHLYITPDLLFAQV